MYIEAMLPSWSFFCTEKCTQTHTHTQTQTHIPPLAVFSIFHHNFFVILSIFVDLLSNLPFFLTFPHSLCLSISLSLPFSFSFFNTRSDAPKHTQTDMYMSPSFVFFKILLHFCPFFISRNSFFFFFSPNLSFFLILTQSRSLSLPLSLSCSGSLPFPPCLSVSVSVSVSLSLSLSLSF